MIAKITGSTNIDCDIRHVAVLGRLFTHCCSALANSAFHTLGVGK